MNMDDDKIPTPMELITRYRTGLIRLAIVAALIVVFVAWDTGNQLVRTILEYMFGLFGISRIPSGASRIIGIVIGGGILKWLINGFR